MDFEAINDTSMLVVWIALTGLWYYIKYVLGQNGYETHLLWGHFKDIANLHNLHDREQDINKKRKYKLLLFAFYVSGALFLVAACALFPK